MVATGGFASAGVFVCPENRDLVAGFSLLPHPNPPKPPPMGSPVDGERLMDFAVHRRVPLRRRRGGAVRVVRWLGFVSGGCEVARVCELVAELMFLVF